MTTVGRLLVPLLLLAAATVGAGAAYACSCAGPQPFDVAVEEAEVAFRGTVLRALGRSKYEVRVDGVIKGSLPPVVTVRAEDARSSSCGVELKAGPLVYAGDRDLYVAQCMSAYHGAGADEVLRRSGVQATRAPDPAAADEGRPWWPLALGLGLGVLGWAAYAVRRRRDTPPPPGRPGDLGTPGAL